MPTGRTASRKVGSEIKGHLGVGRPISLVPIDRVGRTIAVTSQTAIRGGPNLGPGQGPACISHRHGLADGLSESCCCGCSGHRLIYLAVEVVGTSGRSV